MRVQKIFLLSTVLLLLLVAFSAVQGDKRFIDVTVYPAKQHLVMVWEDSTGSRFGNFGRLKKHFIGHGKKLVFAMNGGMFTPFFSPVGLYIENGKTIEPLNTDNGAGNFFLKPNGVFYITHRGKAIVCTTESFTDNRQVLYATQSGPMLVADGKIHSAFTQGSANVQIRNGVGVKENGDMLFSISAEPVNFYDFALHFKEAGCNSALYLDGAVSKMYCPEKGYTDTTGNFGVMVAVAE